MTPAASKLIENSWDLLNIVPLLGLVRHTLEETAPGFYLGREREDWTLYPTFWILGGCSKNWFISCLRTSVGYWEQKGSGWCAAASWYNRQTPEGARDYELQKRRNQQILQIRNLHTNSGKARPQNRLERSLKSLARVIVLYEGS